MVACADDGVEGFVGGLLLEEDAFEVFGSFFGVEACERVGRGVSVVRIGEIKIKDMKEEKKDETNKNYEGED